MVAPEEVIDQCKVIKWRINIQISIVFMRFKLVNYHLSLLYNSLLLCFLYLPWYPEKT